MTAPFSVVFLQNSTESLHLFAVFFVLLVSAANYCSVSQCVTLTRCQILMWKSCNSTLMCVFIKVGIFAFDQSFDFSCQ